MTEQEKQELSKAVADKYGIAQFDIEYNSWGEECDPTWLHDDSTRCFDLMVENDVYFQQYHKGVMGLFDELPLNDEKYEAYADHPTKQEATRIAILRALLAKD